MKKSFLILVMFAMILLFTSCRKDRLCGCVGTSTEPGTERTIAYVTYTNAKRSDAKKACIKTKQSYVVNGETYVNTSDCALKD